MNCQEKVKNKSSKFILIWKHAFWEKIFGKFFWGKKSSWEKWFSGKMHFWKKNSGKVHSGKTCGAIFLTQKDKKLNIWDF